MEGNEEPEIVFKWTNSCRLCLSSESHLEIFAKDQQSEHALDIIKSSLHLTIYAGDPLPRKLCITCLQHIESWNEFRQKCVSTDNQLKERLKQYRNKIDFVQKFFDVVNASNVPTATHSFPAAKASIPAGAPAGPVNESDKSTAGKEPASQPVLEPADSTNLYLERPIKLEQVEINEWEEEPASAHLLVKEEPSETGTSATVEPVVAESSEPQTLATAELIVGKPSGGKIVATEPVSLISVSEYNLRPRAESGPVEFDFAEWIVNEDSFHSTEKLKKKVTPWKCEPCDKYFGSYLALTAHHSSPLCSGIHREGFNCPVCTRLFFSLAELAEHSKYHLKISYHLSPDELRKCELCEVRFADPYQLVKHTAWHSAQTKPAHAKKSTGRRVMPKIKVVEPLKPITTRSSVAKPAPKPSPSLDFACSLCSHRFAEEDRLYDHRFAYHGIPDERVSCDTCDIKFRTVEELTKHVRSHLVASVPEDVEPSSKVEGKLNKNQCRCRRCGRVFKTIEDLTRHEKSQHKNRTPYFCRRCSRRFPTRTQLLLHQRTHPSINVPAEPGQEVPEEEPEPSPPPSVTPTSTPPPTEQDDVNFCQLCNVQFYDNLDIKLHMKSHEQCTNPKMKCHFKSKLRDGRLVYRYQCSKCPQLFTCLRSVSRHRQLVHQNHEIKFMKLKRVITRKRIGNANMQIFKCKDCNIYFKTKESKEHHMAEKHKKKEPVKKELVVKEKVVENIAPGMVRIGTQVIDNYVPCPICTRSFSSNYISKHIKKSHGDEIGESPRKPPKIPKTLYQCRYCDKTCNTKANLANHEACHDPTRPTRYICKGCGVRSVNITVHRMHLTKCPEAIAHGYDAVVKPSTSLPVAVPKTSPPSTLGGYRTCPICLNTYETPNLLELHVMTAHGVEAFERLQQPQAMGPSSLRVKVPELELWREERNKIVRSINGIHRCTLCKLEFTSYQAVTWHRSQHPRGNLYVVQMGESLYQCTICERVFKSRPEAMGHTQEHSADMDLKPIMSHHHPMFQSCAFKCPFCSSSFGSEDTIRNHIFYVHPEGSINSM